MASTTFVDKRTIVEAEWLNEVDAIVWDVFGGASDDATARTNLGVTASWILSELSTVDGSGSGLDADLLDGQHGSYYLPAGSYTAADVLAKVKTVDGAGSGLDADLLDGKHAADFYQPSNILGTVSQSGGVPTGAVIERGSNANGEYVKFADGTMICTSPWLLCDIPTATGSVFRGGVYWVFPATFSVVPVVSPSFDDAYTAGGAAINLTETGGQLRGLSGYSVTGANVIATAIGRWF